MKLLIILGVAFVSLFGAGHKAPSKIDTNDTPIKQTTPKRKQITMDSSISNYKDKPILVVAKNYENNGEGVFYNGSISVSNSYTYYTTPGTRTLTMEYQRLDTSGFYSRALLGFTFVSYLDEDTQQTLYKLDYNFINARPREFGIYSATLGYFRVINSCFIAYNIEYSSVVAGFINDLYDFYTFEDSVFTFNSNFNYNAPHGFNASSIYVFHTAGSYDLDLPWFFCNGYAFNRIKLLFEEGYGTRYIDQNGDLQYNSTSDTSYYVSMEYVNTATGYNVVVNYRNSSTFTESDGDIQYYLTNGAQWVNDSYRSITFIDSLTPLQIDKLTIFNTNLNNGYTDYTSGVVTDIGLASVFSLIGSAFASVSGFLAIQIMPGLSLGLLLFTPLIVGIILAIVWLVKR